MTALLTLIIVAMASAYAFILGHWHAERRHRAEREFCRLFHS